ncbi:hypothetical protein K456DRAFT_1727901 [Colletotrichum gloeosporioides 23]|nr:hypothetical protein K456DRAFT_1727901 [Colletotrichum gloeosporioides 23]
MGDFFRPQDRETYWNYDTVKILEAELYEKRILRVVQDGMVNNDLRHPWQTTPKHQHHTPRHSVRLFPDAAGSSNSSCAFKSWSEWKDCFGRDDEYGNRRRLRRIILMEGVDPRFAELLGVQLGVPPEFWLAHCDNFCSLSIVDDQFNRQGRATYWNVSVPQVRGRPKDQKPLKKGAFYVEAGAFDRAADVVQQSKTNQRIQFDGLISFWGHRNDEQDWTAIILVDPRNVKLRMSPWNEHFLKEPDTCIWLQDESFDRPNMFVEAARKWKQADTTAPHLRGLYDTIGKAHTNSTEYLRTLKDPFAATVMARNLIHSIWDHHNHLFITEIEDGIVDDDWAFDDLDIDGAIQRTSTKDAFKNYQNAFENLNTLRRFGDDVRRIRDALTASDETSVNTGNLGRAEDVEHKR